MLYNIAHFVVSFLAKHLFKLRVEGFQHIPEHGPLIIAANHASHLDIPLLGCTLHRRANFVGKSELFEIPILGWILRLLGGIPIRRGRVDHRAIAEIRTKLQQGSILVFYLEGGRTPDGMLQKPKAGIGMIAAMTGAQVVPAYIKGTYQALPKGKKWFRSVPISIVYGPPVDFSNWGYDNEGKADYQEISNGIMREITTLSGENGKPLGIGTREGVQEQNLQIKKKFK